MSYQGGPRVGRELSPYQGRPHPDTEKGNSELRAIQFRAVTAFNRLRDDVGRLGSANDTVELRRRIAESGMRFRELAQEFRESADAHPAKDANTTQKILRDFQGLLKNSEKLMVTAKAKEAASLPKPSRSAVAAQVQEEEARSRGEDDTVAEQQALLAAQKKQMFVDAERALQFNEVVIEERDQAITEISGQIGEVHQIFQDLAVLVNDQGDMIDDIESNMTQAAVRTKDAVQHVVQAERSQKSAQRRWCFLLCIAFVVVLILLLVLLA